MKKHKTSSTDTVQIVSVVTPICGSMQLTRYQGTRSALIRHGVAHRVWFEVGRSGMRRVHDLTLDIAERYEIKCLAHGQWRVTRFHPPGEPPYLPSQSNHVRTQFDYRASLSAAYNRPIEAFHSSSPGEGWTWYVGTREQLLSAGLVVESQFPSKGRSARARKWSSPEQGDWELIQLTDGRWKICYRHSGFDITPELKREADLASLYQALRQHFGDGVARGDSL